MICSQVVSLTTRDDSYKNTGLKLETITSTSKAVLAMDMLDYDYGTAMATTVVGITVGHGACTRSRRCSDRSPRVGQRCFAAAYHIKIS